MDNRLGFTNFIKDKEKIDEHYEWVLKRKDNFIDELDYLFIALVKELGANKEVKIEELQNIINKLMEDCNKLKKDRDYWKLSFNKQVEASRK